jgi:hypothetical protein
LNLQNGHAIINAKHQVGKRVATALKPALQKACKGGRFWGESADSRDLSRLELNWLQVAIPFFQ